MRTMEYLRPCLQLSIENDASMHVVGPRLLHGYAKLTFPAEHRGFTNCWRGPCLSHATPEIVSTTLVCVIAG